MGREERRAKLSQKWEPRPGIYKSVLPGGHLTIDLFLDGREVTAFKLVPGDEVELYEREIRQLRRSEILVYGYLAPVVYFDKDEETGRWIDNGSVATEDSENPNVVSDGYISDRLNKFKTAMGFKRHLGKVDSFVTLQRYRNECVKQDKPQSWVFAVDDRVESLKEEDQRQIRVPIDVERQRFLTPKGKFADE